MIYNVIYSTGVEEVIESMSEGRLRNLENRIVRGSGEEIIDIVPITTKKTTRKMLLEVQ